MIKNRFLIAGFTFISLGLLGLTFSFVGVSLPYLQIFFAIEIGRTGLLSAIVQLGFALMCFFGGVISDLLNKDKLLMAGCIFLGLSSLFFGMNKVFLINSVILAFMGSGCGFIFISSNTLVVELFPEKRGTYLNIHHFFFAIGSLIGPLFMRYVISNNLRWQLPYRSLIPKGLEGVLITGKPACRFLHFHATHAAVGQAAGVVAALAARERVPLRKLAVRGVQEELARQGAVVF